MYAPTGNRTRATRLEGEYPNLWTIGAKYNLTYKMRLIILIDYPVRANRTPDQLIYSQSLYHLSYHRSTNINLVML